MCRQIVKFKKKCVWNLDTRSLKIFEGCKQDFGKTNLFTIKH